ncbi:sperm flagellar protein 2 isoform X3 [Girardinichthys multiradiatus]|uniref:sperm flagellar protein 2 isoform X3 n=1 Tax=Girardinichthys multiradiatus TaxID=208333 RepID=UPI001FAE597C|nr:sperm flagellar protein 2 isoform X3 [Girardinichthys multiradiatus]
MSAILCRWLNHKLRLSETVDPRNFARDFSNGYLFGEILHKYQMQEDFNMFLKNDSSIAKENNLSRLEPSLNLLGIFFDKKTAGDLMREVHGVATSLLHQLYVALEEKNNTGTSRTAMQPTVKAKLHKKEHEIYSYHLPQLVKPNANQNFRKMTQHYADKGHQLKDLSEVAQPMQQKKTLKVRDEKRMQKCEEVCRQKHDDSTGNHTELLKQPPCSLNLRRKKRQEELKEKQLQTEIAKFEEKEHKLASSCLVSLSSSRDQPVPADSSLGGIKKGSGVPGSQNKLILQSNSKYIQGIRQRLKENAVAQEERQRRVDRFLMEQVKALEAQQEAQLEDQMVRRLMRQTQQEQRLAEQLMQISRQKEVILENRLFREQQYQEQTERDFQQALDREAVLAQRAKLARDEEMKKELELCNRIAAEHAQSRHREHFDNWLDVLGQIVDLATKVGEYRLLTGNLAPEKKNKEWKELFLKGVPLYEPIRNFQPEPAFFTPLTPSEFQKQEILNNLDYDEYTNMVGEWAWPEDAEDTKLPPSTNDILAYVVQRLRKMAHPSIVESSAPSVPRFRIKACVLGMFGSGKTSCLSKIGEALGVCVLLTDTLVGEALRAFKDAEQVIDQQEEDNVQLHASSTSVQSDLNKQEEKSKCVIKRLSTRAMLGAAAEKELRKGNVVPNEMIVDILVEAISHVPAQAGWILDGFPYNITQAHMLEKALGGSVDEGNDFVSNTLEHAADPDLPIRPLPPPPVLDLALLLDIPDECVVRRAYSHGDTAAAAATASQHADNTMYSGQITPRIAAFHDSWPELETWFGEKQNILVRLNADMEEERLYNAVESVLQQVIQQKHEAPANPLVEDVSLDSSNAQDMSSVESCNSDEKGKDLRHSANVSPSSISVEGSNGGNMVLPESAFSSSSSVSQLYQVPEYLCSHWDNICQSYVNNIKQVMQQMRFQRTLVDRHLFNIRERFGHYLGRPDLKQELVSQWQKTFNSIPDDMREDEETKAELHLRLDELQERLWGITDKRREEDEQERTALMCDGWLEEQAAMLINHHSMIIQVELSRFRETLSTLRVYYWSMHRQGPLESVSKTFKISLQKTTGAEDQEDAKDPLSRGLQDQMSDRKDKERKQHPDSTKSTSKTVDQSPSEPTKSSQDKLLADYEQAFQAIRDMMSAEVQQMETKQQNESLQEKQKATEKVSESAKKAMKENQPPTKHADNASEKTQKPTENTHDQKIKPKIHVEYTAALTHEENSAKVRLELVKGHGLMMVNSLQSRAQETFTNMGKEFQACYLSKMKCIDQLSEVAHHHIEAGAKLQYELVLDNCDFYLNGDCQLVPDASPAPRPPPVEIPNRSILTVTQLESLQCQLSNIAPSGLMSSTGFFVFLEHMVSNSLGRNIGPEVWMDLNETRLLEVVSLLTDEFELVDWRRFLLSAALPWPLPSLTQLLDLLQQFKEADADDTGYINAGQYLQIELWFSSESVQNVPEDPSEPLPYNRLANLRKFFFQLFADPSSSPPQLDYVSMLQYFAADPDPRQGFIRALSVELGQHLQESSQSLLVKSLPSIEEATELTSFRFPEDYTEEEAPFSSSDVFKDQEVSISALLNVVCHKVSKMEGSTPLPPGCLSQEEHKQNLENVYSELGYKSDESVPFSVLSKHPYTQMLMETSTHFQLVNILNATGPSG